MEKNRLFRKYIAKITSNIPVRGKKKRELVSDLYNSLQERELRNPGKSPFQLMGDPVIVAKEFRENLGLNEVPGFEYSSKKEFLGYPLLHINFKKNGVAKGFIAIGSVAVGVISVGAVALGVLSFGAITIGLFTALGAVAFSGFLSLGAFSSSFGISLGAVAFARFIAVGGYAQANIAIGDVAHGVVSIFKTSGIGDFQVQLPADREEIFTAIKSAFPAISNFWMNNIMRLF